MELDGLDDTCPRCERTVGDHTLREFAACTDAQKFSLPYEDQPAATITGAVRERFGIDNDVIVADHVEARALVLGGGAGPLSLTLPALLHTFQIGVPGQSPTDVAQVLFLGDRDTMKGYGGLIRDTAHGAINAAMRGRPQG